MRQWAFFLPLVLLATIATWIVTITNNQNNQIVFVRLVRPTHYPSRTYILILHIHIPVIVTVADQLLLRTPPPRCHTAFLQFPLLSSYYNRSLFIGPHALIYNSSITSCASVPDFWFIFWLGDLEFGKVCTNSWPCFCFNFILRSSSLQLQLQLTATATYYNYNIQRFKQGKCRESGPVSASLLLLLLIHSADILPPAPICFHSATICRWYIDMAV